MEKNLKALCKIFYFAFILYVYIHLTACIWYVVIDREKTWIPPYDFIDYTQSHLFEDSVFRKYWVTVYYCVLVLGGNELGPSSDLELFYIVSINLIGAIINA